MSLLNVSIVKDHLQGVYVPIYEVIEYSLFVDIIGVVATCL